MKLPQKKKRKERDPYEPPKEGMPSLEVVTDMEIHFKSELACLYGVSGAILLQHIAYWCLTNKANNKNFHDGAYWTYHTLDAFCWLFPFIKRNAIRDSLKLLEESGEIRSGYYNQIKYDRTKWYSLTESSLKYFTTYTRISQKISHLRKSAHRNAGN